MSEKGSQVATPSEPKTPGSPQTPAGTPPGEDQPDKQPEGADGEGEGAAGDGGGDAEGAEAPGGEEGGEEGGGGGGEGSAGGDEAGEGGGDVAEAAVEEPAKPAEPEPAAEATEEVQEEVQEEPEAKPKRKKRVGKKKKKDEDGDYSGGGGGGGGGGGYAKGGPNVGGPRNCEALRTMAERVELPDKVKEQIARLQNDVDYGKHDLGIPRGLDVSTRYSEPSSEQQYPSQGATPRQMPSAGRAFQCPVCGEYYSAHTPFCKRTGLRHAVPSGYTATTSPPPSFRQHSMATTTLPRTPGISYASTALPATPQPLPATQPLSPRQASFISSRATSGRLSPPRPQWDGRGIDWPRVHDLSTQYITAAATSPAVAVHAMAPRANALQPCLVEGWHPDGLHAFIRWKDGGGECSPKTTVMPVSALRGPSGQELQPSSPLPVRGDIYRPPGNASPRSPGERIRTPDSVFYH